MAVTNLYSSRLLGAKSCLSFMVVLLLVLLSILFFSSFLPNKVSFSNDGPLGGMVAQQNRLPQIITGLWQDLNWVGSSVPSPSPTLSTLLRLITTPFGFSKW